MPCGGCRKAPRTERVPSSTGTKPVAPKVTPTVIKTTGEGSGGQRIRITGLNYVPKDRT